MSTQIRRSQHAFELGTAREVAVDEQHTVHRHRRAGRGVVQLGERVDAAERHRSVAVRQEARIEEQAANRLEIERVAVVPLTAQPVVAMRLCARDA